MASQRERIRMTEEEVASFLAAQRKLHVATLNRDGSPHLMPMYFLLADGRVQFWTYTRSQKMRNLQRDARITVMAEEGQAYFDLRGVQIRGRAQLSTDVSEVSAFAERLQGRYFGPVGDEARAYVMRAAQKRTLVTVEPLHVVSWDHSRLVEDGPSRRS